MIPLQITHQLLAEAENECTAGGPQPMTICSAAVQNSTTVLEQKDL